ncbi:MAG: ribosomal protein [Verrucomicrobiota bacterium]|jgi:large subunit ribosomal protein L4
MKLTVKDLSGKAQGQHDLKFELVENGRGTQAVHDVVTAYRANQRMGTACTKTMGEVAGTGKKPWRQKGTGRARAGSFASPLWVGGGVVFGPKPRDFGKKVNARTKQLALRKALSERFKAGDVEVVSDLKLANHKTKGFVSALKALGADAGTALVVDASIDANLDRAARNVDQVELTTAESLNTYQVLRPAKLVITKAALEKIEARLNA